MNLTTVQAIKGWLTCLYLLSAQDKHLSLGVLINTISLPCLTLSRREQAPLGNSNLCGAHGAMKHCGLQVWDPFAKEKPGPYPTAGVSINDALPGRANQGAKWLLQSEMWNLLYHA